MRPGPALLRCWPLALAGLAVVAGAGVMAILPETWRQRPLPFAGAALLIGAAMLAASAWVARQGAGRAGVAIILVSAALAHVLATGLEHSDDVNRYLIEGRQILHGQNPYAVPPADPAARVLVAPEIAAAANHPERTAIYPPLALFAHAGVAAIDPTPRGMTVAMLLVAAALVWASLALIRTQGGEPGQVVMVAWNPVLIAFTSGEAHHDALAGLLVLAALLAGAAAPGRMLFVAGLAVLAKPFAVAALPVLLHAARWRGWWIPPAVALIAVAPFLAAGDGLWRSAGVFAGWHHHGALEPWFRLALEAWLPAAWLGTTVRIGLVLAAAGVWWWAVWRRRAHLPPAQAVAWSLIALLLALPTLHAWYLTILVGVLPFARSRAALLWTALAGTYWLHGLGMGPGVSWAEVPVVTLAAHAPVLVLFAWELLRMREELACPPAA